MVIKKAKKSSCIAILVHTDVNEERWSPQICPQKPSKLTVTMEQIHFILYSQLLIIEK